MKINFGLLGLVAAQSGDDRWEDNSYDYDISTDRWSNENQYSLDQANAGITFGVMARVTKQQDAKHFQKALKLSCWNSNMIRDMNNDNKFSVYFNDQVEYKRFYPGMGAGSPAGGTVDNLPGRDDLSWLYAVGDLRTGNNHQYGFENNESDPYYPTNAGDTNRMGGVSDNTQDGRNNNRLRQMDEIEYKEPYTAVSSPSDSTKPSITQNSWKTKNVKEQGISVEDANHSIRPDKKWSFRKWGYQSDNVERAVSNGYNENTVVYHFGHHDNRDNAANRPNMRYGASNDQSNLDETYGDTAGENTEDLINKATMSRWEFDFHGFKDDWRYSLRMGGCLYEAARWVYDESSFHRTSRLTYTDDTLFMDDPFSPLDDSDIFGAHAKAAHSGLQTTSANPNLAYASTQVAEAAAYSTAAYSVFQADNCYSANSCSTKMDTYGDTYKLLNKCFNLTDNVAACVTPTVTAAIDASVELNDTCIGSSTGKCKTEYAAFKAARSDVFEIGLPGTAGCLYDAASGTNKLKANCGGDTGVTSTALNSSYETLVSTTVSQMVAYLAAKEAEGKAEAALANVSTDTLITVGGEFTTATHDALFTTSGWENAGATDVAASTDYQHGNCNGDSCESQNVATPSSGGVFADVHWVHVFNAHIFPLQDVGYYQYDQTLGLGNINQNNDSITSRDGYGYNIYESAGTGKHFVLRDVWGAKDASSYIDTGNNAPDKQHKALKTTLNEKNALLAAAWAAFNASTCSNQAMALASDANYVDVTTCDARVSEWINKYEALQYCVNLIASSGCGANATNCAGDNTQPCFAELTAHNTARDLVLKTTNDGGCMYDNTNGGTAVKSNCTTGPVVNMATLATVPLTTVTETTTAALHAAAAAAGVARAALDSKIHADEFHNQYGTLNIGNLGNPATYAATHTGDDSTSADMVPILTKTRRKIEDFNIVMANPTYEGHGFLNFVATYHDHTENHDDGGNWIRQVGKRFLSTIGGLTTASNKQRNVCRAVKDGIDSYRMNGFVPAAIDNGSDTGGHDGKGHDDPFLAPLGPGAAGNYGNGQRCGAAMYENFGDWFLRPAQTYSAYHNFSQHLATTDGSAGWSTAQCADDGDNLSCLGGMASYNYWAFILSEEYNPILSDNDSSTIVPYSAHELWRNGSQHYDMRGSAAHAGRKRRQAVHNAYEHVPNSSGRGFAISSFPHNELGKDFRFNIRTLHNMGNGVAKQYYQIQNLKAEEGNEYAGGSLETYDLVMQTSNLKTTDTVWSYYFYAVDTIKIAFPEFVARINHCDKHNMRNTSHCTVDNKLEPGNGNPDDAAATQNYPSAYPGYDEEYPWMRLGFQEIIIDGVTMKKTATQYDSRVANSGTDWNKQYHFSSGLRGDDHTRATLHYLDSEFANEDKSLHEMNGVLDANAMCSDDMLKLNMGTDIKYFGGTGGSSSKDSAGQPGNFQGYSDSYQPLKPCASWCALDSFGTSDILSGKGVDNTKQTFTGTTVTGMSSLVGAGTKFSKYGGICGRVLRIDGLLQTYDELHNRQYGVLQEIWVQLQYAYQESLDNSARTLDTSSCNDDSENGTDCNTKIRKVQSPFPNVFFSAPEVVDIRGFCPSSNMKCRGYMSDQHQPYGGARVHIDRVHWNASSTRSSANGNNFGANMNGAQTGNDWAINRDFHADSKWPWNYHSYTGTGGTAFGGTSAGTAYTGRDMDHKVLFADGAAITTAIGADANVSAESGLTGGPNTAAGLGKK